MRQVIKRMRWLPLALGLCLGAAPAPVMAAGVVQASDPIPVAHRGLLRHAPENTLPAFAACLELGMGFELDIRTTKDGYLVVLHDDSVKRTTNGPAYTTPGCSSR